MDYIENMLEEMTDKFLDQRGWLKTEDFRSIARLAVICELKSKLNIAIPTNIGQKIATILPNPTAKLATNNPKEIHNVQFRIKKDVNSKIKIMVDDAFLMQKMGRNDREVKKPFYHLLGEKNIKSHILNDNFISSLNLDPEKHSNYVGTADFEFTCYENKAQKFPTWTLTKMSNVKLIDNNFISLDFLLKDSIFKIHYDSKKENLMVGRVAELFHFVSYPNYDWINKNCDPWKHYDFITVKGKKQDVKALMRDNNRPFIEVEKFNDANKFADEYVYYNVQRKSGGYVVTYNVSITKDEFLVYKKTDKLELGPASWNTPTFLLKQ